MAKKSHGKESPTAVDVVVVVVLVVVAAVVVVVVVCSQKIKMIE